MIKKIGNKGLILAAFAIVTTSAIAFTFAMTNDKIENAKQQQLLMTLNQLVPASSHNNLLHDDCVVISPDPLLNNEGQRAYRARMEGQNVAVLIETTAADGYSGDIDILVAIDDEQTVLGARVLNHKETPGLGDKIDLRISDWILSFSGQKYSQDTHARWAVKKDGGQFDQFTGATITPRAVVKAVAKAAEYTNNNIEFLFNTPSNCYDANTNGRSE
ncbi:electron transport complex subunit RsxG [Agaribacter flavus]|uniref:Ion-translocating oxidoreductase complex subunit G n=1 Tax=Agaribacter flavus TaxID=1902781 RepID=A0ABV7FLD4_9ALTE